MLSIRENQYVEAAKALGVRDVRIVLRHMLPNLVSPLLVMTSFEAARIITTEAALGFLGLGVPPPDPSWGNILSDGREYVQDASWISTFPGLALMITVLGMNLLGDALRDMLDPRLRF
jgi:peptide/nickel transport system permease protein